MRKSSSAWRASVPADLAQARKEYELYMRLFPTGDGATRVRQRLATLAPPEQGGHDRRQAAGEARTAVHGRRQHSQYYYGGNQTVQTTFNTLTNVPVSPTSPR